MNRIIQKIFATVDNRYISFFCGFCMMGAAGTEYMFSTYAPQLKTLMGYSQTQINFLGTCGNMGIYLGFYMGILHDFTNARFVSLVGGVLLFLGWFLLYLGSMQIITTNYITMGLFMYIQGNGSAACYTAAISNNVPKFSGKARGTIVGVLVSMFGLTSAIFSPIYTQVFNSEVEIFLLFFSVTLPIVAFSGIFFLAPIKSTVKAIVEDEKILKESSSDLKIEKKENDHLLSSNYNNYDDYNNDEINEKNDQQIQQKNNETKNNGNFAEISTKDEKKNKEDEENNNNNTKKKWKEVRIKNELNSLEIFKNFDFHLLFFVFMLGTGVGLTWFNNLGSLVLTMGGTEASWLVTLLSLCNCAGRLLFGFSSDLLVLSNILSRSSCLFFGLALMAASQIYFAGAITQSGTIWLIPGVIMLGLSYGALMSLVPALVNEFLGTKYFGGNWGIVRASPAISGFVLSTIIAGKLYERNIVGDGVDCFGWSCYGWSFLIDFGVVLIAMIGCFGLIIRWYLFERSLKKSQNSSKI